MFQNKQPREAQAKNSGEELDFVSVFHTLQGEGPYTGYASIFIRLAGCNLQCPGCDSDYTSYRRTKHIKEIIAQDIYKLIFIYPHTKLFVITGGEPLRQNIVPLIKLLYDTFGLHVQIESNGVYAPSFELTDLMRKGLVTYIVSPKTSRISATAELWASAYKYVISADSIVPHDGLPRHALGHPATPYVARPQSTYQGKIYINPADVEDPEINKANMDACVQSALRFGYICGLQAHKIWQLP